MTEFIVVFITAPCEDDAASMARELVGAGLAGCVNIIRGARSIYRWEGKIEDHAEVLMIAKTRGDNLAALMKRVKELHSYRVPEIVALPLLEGSADYLAWLRGVTVQTESM
ncbi:MAG: divalent-cation tolerance protein CutA [Thermodesulfovibrio sp.]|nr:divalent-cation tolerance protein CutA [Thermodesulfovibrio sp.]